MEALNEMRVQETGELITPELIAALCKAQAEFSPALKDASNPFFRSKYAPLDAVWNACKEGLKNNQLFVSQPTYNINGKTMLRTRVYHASGGFISSEIEVVVAKQNDPQAFGSALTYFRRYSLASILGVVSDDDDAEAATDRNNTKAQPKSAEQGKTTTVKAMTGEQKEEIMKLLGNPSQTEETVKKVSSNIPVLNYDTAAQTIGYLKKQIALKAEQAAKEKVS